MIYFQGMKLYIQGLVAVVTLSFKLDPYNGDYVFIFCNRKIEKIQKISKRIEINQVLFGERQLN